MMLTAIPMILLGLAVGTATAWLHQRASWRASERMIRSGHRHAALLGLPLRVALPALALFSLARWSTAALLAALLAFALTQLVGLRRAPEEPAR